eukprot:542697_1
MSSLKTQLQLSPYFHLFQGITVFTLTAIFQPNYNTTQSYLGYIHWLLWIYFYICSHLKLFIIFHDCGHNSFFEGNNKLNIRWGYLLELIIFTPFNFWRKSHAKHHSNQGNLDKIDFGSTIHFTSKQIKNIKPRIIQFLYLFIFRFPPIFFIICPLFIWWIWLSSLSIILIPQNNKKRLEIIYNNMRIYLSYLLRPFIFYCLNNIYN